MRSGCGKTSGPAVQPAGSAQSTVGGSPESPGLVQYVCQPGAMRWRMPTQKDAPGSTEAVSPSRVTETFGGPGGFGALTVGARAGSAARPGPASIPTTSLATGMNRSDAELMQ